MKRHYKYYVALVWLLSISFNANGTLTTDFLTIPSGKDYMRLDAGLNFVNSLGLDIHQEGVDTGIHFFEPTFDRLSPNTMQSYDFIIERRETTSFPKIGDSKGDGDFMLDAYSQC